MLPNSAPSFSFLLNRLPNKPLGCVWKIENNRRKHFEEERVVEGREGKAG
jgi:hypothetical protein